MASPFKINKITAFKIAAATLSVLFTLSAAGLIFIAAIRLGYIDRYHPLRLLKHRLAGRLNDVLHNDPCKALIRAASAESGECFVTTWDHDTGVALSKSIFTPTNMFGHTKFRMRPNIGVYNVRVWNMLAYEALVLPKTPAVTSLLLRNKVDNLISFNTDENGFKETSNISTSGKHTIFLMGDSFTEGLWVRPEDTFSSVLARHLESDGGPAKIFNLGVNGFSTLESSWMLEHHAPKLHPTMVILNAFPNDVHVDCQKVVKGESALEENFKEMFSYIDRMHSYCESRNIIFMVAAIPTKEQFDHLRSYSHFQDRLRTWLAQRKIVFLDPRSTFAQIGSKNIYLSWDPHFSAEGHKHYGRFIYDNITRRIKDFH